MESIPVYVGLDYHDESIEVHVMGASIRRTQTHATQTHADIHTLAFGR